jgi:hypothetical protein
MSSDDRLSDYLRAARVGRRERVAGGGLDPRMAVLRAWQAERLARSHADLLESERYGPAGEFFMKDIYGARDFTQRDHDVMRVYEATRAILPPAMRRALALVVELNALTHELDERLLDVLVDDLGMTGSLTAEQYAEAYRIADNRAERERQIDLIDELGREIEGLVHKPAVGLALRLARVPARLAGWHELQDFFERGFTAFKHMKGSDEFLATILGRERQILDRIYSRAEDPFAIEA